MKEQFSELKSKLVFFSKDKNEKYALDYFDFISWAESKIENKSFVQVVKEKMQ